MHKLEPATIDTKKEKKELLYFKSRSTENHHSILAYISNKN